MKKLSYLIFTVIILFSFCLSYSVSNASTLDLDDEYGVMPISETEGEPIVTNEEQNQPNIGDYDVCDDDLYVASNERNYVMDQIVDGNVYIFGNNVTVTGAVNGSVFIAASHVVIDENAYIACHLFVAAETVEINGAMLDVYSASQNLVIHDGARVSRDLRAVAKNITLSGKVGRDVYLSAKNINLTENQDELLIYGDLKYSSANEIQNISEEQVKGEIEYKKEYFDEEDELLDVILDYVFSAINTLVFDIVLYIALLFLAPKFVEKAKDYVSTRGILAFALGVVFTILVPLVAILLLFIGVGAGLATILGFIYAVVLMLNAFVVTLVSNEFIASKLSFVDNKIKKGLLLIPVSLVIWAVRKLPYIGSFASMIVFLCGIGVIVLYQYDKMKKA